MANNVKIVLDSKSTGAAALVKELVDLMPGVTTGSIEVSFNFSADKGEDEQYTAVQELCPWTLVALFSSKLNGVTQQVVIDCIPEMMAMSDAQRKVLRESLKESTTKRLEEMGLFVQRTRTGKTRIEVQGDGEMTVTV
ncbi:MAG: hypothetical protein JW384_01145 [Nitrosomonadaceae bacterium]|nr:hypothetical protein [Nitrosomonadaceae bacterium]